MTRDFIGKLARRWR